MTEIKHDKGSPCPPYLKGVKSLEDLRDVIFNVDVEFESGNVERSYFKTLWTRGARTDNWTYVHSKHYSDLREVVFPEYDRHCESMEKMRSMPAREVELAHLESSIKLYEFTVKVHSTLPKFTDDDIASVDINDVIPVTNGRLSLGKDNCVYNPHGGSPKPVKSVTVNDVRPERAPRTLDKPARFYFTTGGTTPYSTGAESIRHIIHDHLIYDRNDPFLVLYKEWLMDWIGDVLRLACLRIDLKHKSERKDDDQPYPSMDLMLDESHRLFTECVEYLCRAVPGFKFDWSVKLVDT